MSCEPLSKLLVSPLITPIVVPYIIPYITPFKEFRLWFMWVGLAYTQPYLGHGSRRAELRGADAAGNTALHVAVQKSFKHQKEIVQCPGHISDSYFLLGKCSVPPISSQVFLIPVF